MSAMYLVFDIALVAYVLYSWYWQAQIDFSARFRPSSIIWAGIFIVTGIYGGYFEPMDRYLVFFIAIALVMSMIDGCSGLTDKRIVISGYFRRTIKYQELEHVTLLTVPDAKKPMVMAVFQTQSRHAYYLRFSKRVEDVIQALKTHLSSEVNIEVQTMIH